MTSNWLHDYLRDATRRNLCTEIYCSTCGAMEFRHGVFLALERATGQDAGRPASREAVLTIIRTLARIVPAETEAMDFEPAVRCLLFDACSGLPILDREIEDLLADSWAGEVLRSMQEYHAAVGRARREREEGTQRYIRRS